MAGRAHVDVNERRLRPVYDALDNLNNKLAIQLADKILKKQRDLHCAKALKALALLRLNRTDECSELQEELKKIDVWDDSILQCMTMTYKEMQQPEEIASVYELAVAKNPKNEEFLSHLFMAYVRIGNNLKQQKTAMSLHKCFPQKNPYYFWAVMSIYMQALSSEDEKAIHSMLLPLAERMVAKYAKEDKIQAEAEVQLYLMVLEKAGKYEEALAILKDESDGSIGKLVNEREDILIMYLEKLQNWPQLNKLYKQLLKERPDQWLYYVGYLDSAFSLIKSDWKPKEGENREEESPDFTVTLVKQFLDKKLESNGQIRGPYLAKMDFFKRMIEDENDCQDQLLDNLINYYDEFGCRSCCFVDVAPYIDMLNEDHRNQLIKLVADRICTVPEDASTAKKVKNLQKYICMECIERRLGYMEQLSSKERLQKAKELMNKHRDCINYGKDLLPTDTHPVDPLALLAVNLLINVKDQQGDLQDMIWHILLILEEASLLSSSNHEFKILKMEVYSALGAFGPCYKMGEELEIKYVMLDSLGYKVTRYAQPLCHFQSASSFYSTTLKFFHANQKDTPEQIVAAYRYGAFRKVPEMIGFRDRLNTSIQFSHVLFEKHHLDLLQQANSVQETRQLVTEANLLFSCPSSPSHFDGLTDNRDFSVLSYYDTPPRKPLNDHVKLSRLQEVLWIRYRCLSLRILGIALEQSKTEGSDRLANGNSDRPTDGSLEDLETVILQLEKVFNDAKDLKSREEEFATTYAIHGPPRSRWMKFIDGNFDQPVIISAKLYRQLQISKDTTSLETEIGKLVANLRQWIDGAFEKCQKKLISKIWGKEMINGEMFELLSLLIEVSNYIAMMAVFILDLTTRKLKKKSKKCKSGSNEKAGILETLHSFIHETTRNLKDLYKELNFLEDNFVSKELDEETLSEIFEKTQSDLVIDIWRSIQASYKQSLQEASQIIQLKITFLQSL